MTDEEREAFERELVRLDEVFSEWQEILDDSVRLTGEDYCLVINARD